MSTIEQARPAEKAHESRSIPSLDGLRAIAVGSVVFSHSHSPRVDQTWLSFFQQGDLGVECFFVISGFLITGLLLKQTNPEERVDLRRFYIRRTFRIFPAFYAFLLVLGALKLWGHDSPQEPFDWPSFASAGTYTWNYYLAGKGWLLAHCWSLSMEEQFYLVWPLCLYFFSPSTCLRIALWAIAASPAIRVLTYFLFPAARAHVAMMLHSHIDVLMVGSAITLAQHLNVGKPILARFSKQYWIPVVFACLVADRLLVEKFHGAYFLPIGFTIEAFCFGILLLHVVTWPSLPLGKFLNLKLVAHIGRISYSVYLWQQLFTGNSTNFPLNLLWIWLAAEASYRLIERPSLRFRERYL